VATGPTANAASGAPATGRITAAVRQIRDASTHFVSANRLSGAANPVCAGGFGKHAAGFGSSA
jgi:hypothetical protein